MKLDLFDVQVDISTQRTHGESYLWASVYIFVRKKRFKNIKNVKTDKSLPWLKIKVNRKSVGFGTI